MPSISRGRLFQFERQGDRARLLCLKSETGEFLWQFEYRTAYEDLYGYDNGPRCCPVVDDDRVYLFGPAGMLHALRVIDGKVLWKVDTRTAFGVVQNFFGVASTPVVEKDLLLVQVGGSPEGSDDVSFAHLKGNGSGIVAFDKRTGQVRYRVTDELASYASPVLATIGAALVLCAGPRRPGGPGTCHRPRRFPLSLAVAEAGERQCQQSRGGRRSRVHLRNLWTRQCSAAGQAGWLRGPLERRPAAGPAHAPVTG